MSLDLNMDLDMKGVSFRTYVGVLLLDRSVDRLASLLVSLFESGGTRGLLFSRYQRSDLLLTFYSLYLLPTYLTYLRSCYLVT